MTLHDVRKGKTSNVLLIPGGDKNTITKQEEETVVGDTFRLEGVWHSREHRERASF